MITSKIQEELFEMFVDCGVNSPKLFNKLTDKFSDVINNERGHADAEFYEVLTKLMNNENNSGWDTQGRHSSRIKIINDSMFEISERSDEFLP